MAGQAQASGTGNGAHGGMTAKDSHTPGAELVARCFDARTTAHFAHFLTTSYAQHMALGDFYEQIGEAADELAECLMGVEGRFKTFPLITPSCPAQLQAVLDYLTDLHAWVAKNRDKVADGSTELQNLVDEILAVIDRTFYKLKNLT